MELRRKPSYSICMLSFNNAETLAQSVESLVPLSEYHQAEVIIVDNKSSDGSQQILGDLIGARRVDKCIRQKCTRGRGRQLALENSVGNYVLCHMDCDDIFLADGIKSLIDFYHSKYEGLVMMTRGTGLSYSNITIAPRDLLTSIGGWRDINWGEDWDLWERADAKGKYVYCPYPEDNPPHYRARTLVTQRSTKFLPKVSSRYGKYRDAYRIGRPIFAGDKHVSLFQRLIHLWARIVVKTKHSKLAPVTNPYFNDKHPSGSKMTSDHE